MNILPGICRGGGPFAEERMVEGHCERPKNPSTAFSGPPPHEIVGRI